MNSKIYTILLIALLAVIPLASRAADQNFPIAAERYGRLNLFERAQYDKARRLLNGGSYRAAGAEFEKFKVQFPDSEALSYVLFMRGYSLHMAKDRNAAIKIYNEVLDFFGDTIADAAPALFYLGMAHVENGDERGGLEAMLEVVEDEDYQKHPIAAGALRRLADNKWRNGKYEEAIRFWKQTVRDFSGSNPTEANAARDKVVDYYIKEGNYTTLESWLLNDETRNDPVRRRWLADLVFGRSSHGFYKGWGGTYNNFNKAEKTKDVKAFYVWYKLQKRWYDKAGDSWRYYSNAITFASQRMNDKVETRRLIDDSMPLTLALKEPKDRDARYSWLADRMREVSDWSSYAHCIGKISDPLLAAYKRYEMYSAKKEWTSAMTQLEQLEAANHSEWTPRAFSAHAGIYKNVLHQYDEAIKRYRQINKPPGTLWTIQECYYQWGKLKEALTTLSEIENSFPDMSARAAWQKASYYHAAGQAKETVAASRRILKLYPKTGESSKAHQLLEGYGIATGGGLLDE